ncbi:MAG: YndJ family transporter [Planctomycetota bacterium]|nr:YndJ family transporter [Planctomycetota bacterium]MEE2991092.1 YndJ family transporter [Planctomycetota bacterium]
MAEVILIAAPFLIVPLGLWHLDREGVAGTGLRRQGLVYFASWCSAILLTISLLLPTGAWAVLLAVPWMLFTYILAGIGLVHFFRHVRSLNEQLCYSAALVYVAVGGTWAVISRSGMQVMDFEPTIVLLTAVHFHYAGFALPLLSGLAIRTMTRHHLARLMILLIIVGIPLVGVGIAGDPLVEIIAVGILATGCVGMALVQLGTALRCSLEPARGLLLVSSISLLLGMLLAVIYGIGEYRGEQLLGIPLMIPLHGIANSAGFSLAGLYGWRVLRRSAALPRD